MRNSFCSCSIAAAICLLATVSSSRAAPLSSYLYPQSGSLHSETREPCASLVDGSSRYPVLIQRDVDEGDVASVGTLESTPMDHIARYAIITQLTSPPMARPTGGMLLESTSSGSSPPTPGVAIGNSCSTAARAAVERGYCIEIAILVLCSCTLAVVISHALYFVYRQWRSHRLYNGKWSTVNLYSSPETRTPKPKPRLSLSLPDTDKTPLKHKASTSTLYSISEWEEPTNDPSSRPPSHTKGPISLPDSPALAQCWPLSPSSLRTVAEGQQSSFLPLR